MLFNSYEFIFIFLPFTFFIYFYLNQKKYKESSKFFLVISSLFFYSWWNISYLPLLLFSMLFNYKIGNLLVQKKTILKVREKHLLVLGITLNLMLLGYYKYSDFFISNSNLLFNTNAPLLNLALPLAISFFTFQQIAYLVDSYRGETKAYNFLNYAVFVSFFPQLIAGPIVHHKEMMPQFENYAKSKINYHNIAIGLFVFTIGLFKKVIIADTFSVWATTGFDTATALNFVEAWTASLSYTFQLYFDFSGYTDMAIGVALLFNIKLPINFNAPYKAKDIQDFWRRWHMTLSRFLRDYIYIPLGGNRKGVVRTYFNLFFTFILAGIWHGAGWTFIFWGFLHGFALIIHKIWEKIGFKLWSWLAWIITFNFINFSWIFFRAKEWEDAIKVIEGMLGVNGVVLPAMLEHKLSFLDSYGIEFGSWLARVDGEFWTILVLLGGFFLVFKTPVYSDYKFSLNYKTLLFSIFAFTVSVLSLNKVSEFLYFNF